MIDGRNFYDQPINDLIKQYDEVRKVSTEQSDYYTTGYLSDVHISETDADKLQLHLIKQKAWDANPRAIQQIVLQGKSGQKLRLYTFLKNQKKRF